MPTSDRKPRRKLKTHDAAPEAWEDMALECWLATPEDWDNGLRRRCVRALMSAGHKEDIAIGLAGVAERKPAFILPRPPSDIIPRLRELGRYWAAKAGRRQAGLGNKVELAAIGRQNQSEAGGDKVSGESKTAVINNDKSAIKHNTRKAIAEAYQTLGG